MLLIPMDTIYESVRAAEESYVIKTIVHFGISVDEISGADRVHQKNVVKSIQLKAANFLKPR